MSDEKTQQPAPSPTGMIASQYDQDFAGMAVAPFSDEARRILAECPRHEDVEVKPDGICYMPGVWYRRQLTRAFGAGAWAIKPTGPARTVGNSVEYPGALYILGRWVAEATGGQPTSEWMSHADAIQGAKTDCLSKCCGHGLAMASELWDKTWREAWMEKYTTREWREGKNGGKGKWVYKLKDQRDPKAANLMGAPSNRAVQDDESPHGMREDGDGPIRPAAPHPANPDTLSEAARHAVNDFASLCDAEQVAAVAGQFKRLKFTKGGIRLWLSALFGVDTVHGEPRLWIEKLTAVQADDAAALLATMEPGKTVAPNLPEAYLFMLENLRSNGRVLPKGEAAA